MLHARQLLLPLSLAIATGGAQAQDAQAVRAGDDRLSCRQISDERATLDPVIKAGDPNNPSIGKSVAGSAANAGGQVAGAVAAAGAGIFGVFGNVVSKVSGAVAQQQVEQRMGPDAEAIEKGRIASERDRFLNRLAMAKTCQKDNPDQPGKTLSAEEFAQLTNSPAAGKVVAMDASTVKAASTGAVTPLDAKLAFDGNLKYKDRRFYIAEYRVLFEVSGKVSAHTRAGYMPGTNYGATNSTIKYQVAKPDIAALQAIVDKSWEDFQERMRAAGIPYEEYDRFVAENGEVYAADTPASTPEAPVYFEENLGYTVRNYLVLSPTGKKIHSRGFAGLGAGNIGKRLEFSKGQKEALSVSVALSIANLESSGGGSSILNRSGASTAAGEGMMVGAPSGFAAQGHVDAGMLRLPKPVAIPGSFAQFKEVGGYDTQKDAAVRSLQIAGALAGVAANKSKTVELEVSLDGPATTRMALQGLATFNRDMTEVVARGLQ